MAVSQVGGTSLDRLVDLIIPSEVVLFLNKTLVRQPFFILNWWSFVHLGIGMLVGYFFPKRFKQWFWLNIIFEFVEFVLALGGNPLFVEEVVDIVWDISLSMFGFLILSLRKPRKKSK